MKNELMYLRWQRNLLAVLLVGFFVWGCIGWYRYREERIVKEGLERWITNTYQSYDWGG